MKVKLLYYIKVEKMYLNR